MAQFLQSVDKRSALVGFGVGVLLVLFVVLAVRGFVGRETYISLDVDASDRKSVV